MQKQYNQYYMSLDLTFLNQKSSFLVLKSYFEFITGNLN